jgi:hypothetical protein
MRGSLLGNSAPPRVNGSCNRVVPTVHHQLASLTHGSSPDWAANLVPDEYSPGGTVTRTHGVHRTNRKGSPPRCGTAILPVAIRQPCGSVTTVQHDGPRHDDYVEHYCSVPHPMAVLGRKRMYNIPEPEPEPQQRYSAAALALPWHPTTLCLL